MRYLVLTLVGLMFCQPLAAQNDSSPPLRSLSIQDYLRAVPEILNQASDNSQTYFDLRAAVASEFNLRYSENDLSLYSFDDLANFYLSVGIGANLLVSFDRPQWLQALVKAGLRDQHIQSVSHEVQVGFLNIRPIHSNFDNLHQNEYLLEVHDDSNELTFYLMAAEDRSGTTFFTVPVPYVGVPSDTISSSKPESGRLTTEKIEDINGDGTTEWIVLNDGYGYWSSCAKLFIIGWQHEKLVNLASQGFDYCIPIAQQNTASAEYRYDTENDRLRLELIENRVDGWDCHRQRIDTLLWNGTAYDFRRQTTYEKNLWCDLRTADDAIKQRNYPTAIALYDHSLTSAELSEQMKQYLIARLALAYALDGQVSVAASTLQSIQPSGQMGALLINLQNAFRHQSAMDLCQSAFDFFKEINATNFADQLNNPYPWTPKNFYFGREFDDPRDYPLPDPDQAGCDISQFQAVPAPIVNDDRTIETSSEVRNYVLWDLPEALKKRNYADVLMVTNQILALPEDRYEDLAQAIHYSRGYAYEMLKQSAEAAAEYETIYDTDPVSAWGKLAALHLEHAGTSS